MTKLYAPIEQDPNLWPKVSMYREAAKVKPNLPSPTDPFTHPVPDVTYDENGFPEMPPDITAISLQELGRLYQAVESWYEYLNSMMTNADVEKNEKKIELELVISTVKKELTDSGVPKSERDEAYRTDFRYIQANAAYLEAQTYFKRVEDVKKWISKRFDLISREITRRSEELKLAMQTPEGRFYDSNKFPRRKI